MNLDNVLQPEDVGLKRNLNSLLNVRNMISPQNLESIGNK